MTRQEFIFTLFDNGNGLTFDQIEAIERRIKDGIPDGLIDDILKDCANEDGSTIPYIEAEKQAMELGYEVFIDNIDCTDMLELRDVLKNECQGITDMQVYHLWYVIQREV